MPVSNLHRNAQIVSYPSFSGGLNLSMPPTALAKNELQEARNFEFDTSIGAMKTRAGLLWVRKFEAFDDVPSHSLVSANYANTLKPGVYLFREGSASGKTLYEDAAVVTISNDGVVGLKHVVGYYFQDKPYSFKYSGEGVVNSTMWDNVDQGLVASGGQLQRVYHNVYGRDGEIKDEWWGQTISSSPDGCRQVFTRDGRVGVVCENDTLRFSAVGDYTSWTNDPSDASSGQFVDIGYKDGMDIDVVVPLSKDLIIFKSPTDNIGTGTIFRLVGSYPDWQVVEVAQGTGTFSVNSVCAVGNDVYYVTPSGLATLSAVNSYSEISAEWPDRKISKELQKMIDETAQLWNIPTKQQLWLRPNNKSSVVWIFNYAQGIWTEFDFPIVPVFVYDQKGQVYLFSKNDIFSMQANLVNDWIDQDEEGKDVKKPISAGLKLGTIENGHQTLAKTAEVTYMYEDDEYGAESSGEMLIGKYELDMKNDAMARWRTARSRFMFRDYSITPEIKVTGSCAVSKASIEIAEV